MDQRGDIVSEKRLLVQLEHPITGEYVYPKVLQSGVIFDDDYLTLKEKFNNVSKINIAKDII